MKEYLTHSNICNGKKNLCTSDLIDLIINVKNNDKPINNELSIDGVNKILNNN